MSIVDLDSVYSNAGTTTTFKPTESEYAQVQVHPGKISTHIEESMPHHSNEIMKPKLQQLEVSNSESREG